MRAGEDMNTKEFNDRTEPSPSWAHSVAVYKLKLDFQFDNHVCTRTITVPADSTLDDLHTMIQACGNWLNYHLYDFKFVQEGRLVKGEPLWQHDELEPANPEIPFVDTFLMTLEEALREFPSMLYSYDYGDGWEISILWLGYADSAPSFSLPRCLAGKGAWPPDDVGGEGGFSLFLDAIGDPSNEEYECIKSWGKGQGYEPYSLARRNGRLAYWEEFRTKV